MEPPQPGADRTVDQLDQQAEEGESRVQLGGREQAADRPDRK